MKMSITELAHPDYHGPAYVLNKSSGKLRGNVVFNVTDEGMGSVIPVTVPDTFLAIDLAARATKDQLVKSHDFRQALNRGLLVLVDEEEGEEINNRPGAAQEQRRLRKNQEMSEAIRSASAGAASDATLPKNAPEPALGDVVGSAELEGIHPRIWAIESKIGEEGEIGVINMIRAIVGDLSLKDLRYVLGVAKAGNHKKLGRYASNQIRKKKGLKPKKRKAA